MKSPYTLLTPGPVSFPPSVKKALSEPSLHHRSDAFKTLFQKTQKPLQTIFQTKEFVLCLTGSGTSAMEAALTNTLSSGDSALCISIGKFGERWESIAKAYGIKIASLKSPAGDIVPPKKIDEYLKNHPETKTILTQACETSTGTNQPLHELAEILKKYPQILFVVDGITGLGTMNLPMDSLGIDVLITGSQKTFMIPTGMAFIAFSSKAWNFCKSSTCPRYYFNLEKELKAQQKGQTVFSSNVTLIRALKASLDLYEEKGLNTIIARCQSLAKATHIFCEHFSLSLFSKYPSSALTSIKLPETISGLEIKKALEENHNIIIASGQGDLVHKMIRIGHIGPITNADLLRSLQALGLELNKKQDQLYTKEKLKKALEITQKELNKTPEIF